jgi:hypothetical protein
MARLALAIGLAAAGAFTGGITFGLQAAFIGLSVGFTLGNVLGSVFFPVRIPDQFGSRLNDLTISSSTNGAPIPIGYNTFRFAGNIIWSPGLVEHATTTKISSKGGPSYNSTLYRYTASFACAFGEGDGDISKIWFDAKVAYDNSAVTSGINYRGNYSVALLPFAKGDVVTFNGKNWIAKGPFNFDAPPGLFPLGIVVWDYYSGSTSVPNQQKYPPPTLYRGTETQNPDPLIQGIEGVSRTPAFRGIIYAVWEDFDLSDFGNRIPNIQALVTFVKGKTLDDLVSDVCLRAGLDSTQIDVSHITGIPVRGYLLTSSMDAKSALQNPLAAYFVDGVETDFKLKFVPRGSGSSVLQIPEDDLGLVADKGKLVETIGQQQELPREVDVTYIDANLDYQQNKQHKQRSRRIVKTKQNVTLSLPMVLTADEARAIGEKAMYLAELERKPFDFNLWKMTYAVLDPTDICQFVYEGHVFQIRIVNESLGVNYTMSVSGVSEQTAAYNSVVLGGQSEGIPTNQGQNIIDTVLFLLDVPYLQDSDAVSDRSQTGYYFGMSATSSLWPHALLYKSSDNVTFDSIDSSNSRMFYGTVVGTLGDPPALWTWDDVNTLTIMPADPAFTFSGTSEIAVLNGANALIVQKADGSCEVLQYRDAVQNGDGSYTLGHLLRGRRNTEYAAFGHGSGEKFFEPSTGLKRDALALSSIGMTRYYKGVTVGQDSTTVTSQSFTDHANDLKPASPVQISAARDGSHNATFSWIRRTRYAGDWLNNTGMVPLNEDSEQYSIDVYNGGSVVRTINWTPGTYDGNGNPLAAYSAAAQTTDFGSAQSSIHVKVYQISAQVGRGFPGDATV